MLKPYQNAAVKFCIKNPYAILSLDMGLGKSLTALTVWQKTQGGGLLIVCPAYLIQNWVGEIRKWFGDKYRIDVFDQGKKIHRPFDTDIAITSDGLVSQCEEVFEWADTVIKDECQSLKEMTSKVSKNFHKLVYENNINRLMLLTGTPIQNRVAEYYSLIALCHYSPALGERSEFLDRFPDYVMFANYFSHRDDSVIMVRGRAINIVKWKGFKHISELKEYLAPIYFRVKSSDVLDLDPIIYKDIFMADQKDKKLAEEFDNLSALWESDPAMGYMNSVRKREAALETSPFTSSYVKSLHEEGVKQVVIYTDHVESCEKIAEGLKCVPITGKISPKRRLEIGKAFQAGEIKDIVATYGSFSTGVNLTRAHNMVLNDWPWVPGILDQAIYRIQRIGQENNCIIHNIWGSPQAKKISELIKEKRVTIEAVT